MPDGAVRVEYEDHLAILTLDRPEQLNAMSDHMEGQLWAAFEELEARDDVYCVLWRAEGRAFSAGRDVSELGNRAPGESDYQYIAFGHGKTHRFLVPPRVPIVCAIQGWCIGGMWERALLCDVLLAADDAKFRLPELAHGVIPDSGGTARLFQICGPALVSDLVLTTRVLDAEEALRHGVVSRVVPRADLDDEALQAAARDRGDAAARGAGLASEPARHRHPDRAQGDPRRAARPDARVHLRGLPGVPHRPRRGPPPELPHHLTTPCRFGALDDIAVSGAKREVTSGSRWGRASRRRRGRPRSCCG